jgi:hypothetical protein
VPVEESVARLEGLGRDIQTAVYPEGGHAIRDRKTQRVQDSFLADLVAFVHEATRR